MPSLKITDGAGKGAEFALTGRATLGRARDCTIQVKAAESSRLHAEVFPREDGYCLRDLGSSNGTFLNEVGISEQVLRHGDRIRICSVVLEYSDERAEPKAAEPAAVAEAPVAESAEPAAEGEAPVAESAEPSEPERTEATGPVPPTEVGPRVEAEAKPAPKAPPEIPGYEIGERIQRNEISVTYRATDRSMGRPAAVEVLRQEYCRDPEWALERIRLAAQLEHPAIARIYSAGVEGGAVYFTRELAAGQSLWKLNGRLEPAEVIDIGVQVADALAEAHKKSVVHGSLRPDRIVRTEQGHARLLGLGLPLPEVGTLSAEPDLQRRPNRVVYMAPELLAGGFPTPASDVYALGAVLYHAVCGEPPFVGISEAVIAPKVASEIVKPVAKLRPDAPGPLARAIEKMLMRSPSARFGSMAQVREELEGIRGKAARPVRAEGVPAVVVERAEPRMVAASTIIIVILTLLLLASLFALGRFAGRWFVRQGAESFSVLGPPQRAEAGLRGSTPVTTIPAA